MKNPLMLLAISIMITASCSKNSDTNKDQKVSLGNDSLVTRLQLKIGDKTNLMLDKQIFTSSNGSALITGKQNGQYWLGLFDKGGNEIITKRYDSDPETFIGINGRIIKPTYNHFYKPAKEYSNKIFVTRQLRESSDLNSRTAFVEDLTIINLDKKIVSTSYSTIIPGEQIPYTSFIGPWINNGYVTSKTKTRIDGYDTDTDNIIYNEAGIELSRFTLERPRLIDYLYYTVLQENIISGIIIADFSKDLLFTSRDVKTGKYIKSTVIYKAQPQDESVEFSSAILNQHILNIQLKISDVNKNTKNVTVKVDTSTYEIL